MTRPRYDADQCMTLDGKVGLRPVVETKLAVRNSKNRPKGTPVMTPVEMTKHVYEHVQHVIPAINRVWPDADQIFWSRVPMDEAAVMTARLWLVFWVEVVDENLNVIYVAVYGSWASDSADFDRSMELRFRVASELTRCCRPEYCSE
ncbi:hypothetical protein PR002_g7503 [Phytophthora rubi]|uniref:Uncharacterized protein n=1 Tax=Phytophthora rubi TaxID=129364 RepID=A0A6A3N5G6_9STRA|nr:hypothetical protein PR002_g7503 [Phytophthora rubi]